jgi:hypothetical protein
LSHGRSCSWRHGRTALSRSSDTSSITRALESWNHSVVKVLMIIWYIMIWYIIPIPPSPECCILPIKGHQNE